MSQQSRLQCLDIDVMSGTVPSSSSLQPTAKSDPRLVSLVVRQECATCTARSTLSQQQVLVITLQVNTGHQQPPSQHSTSHIMKTT